MADLSDKGVGVASEARDDGPQTPAATSVCITRQPTTRLPASDLETGKSQHLQISPRPLVVAFGEIKKFTPYSTVPDPVLWPTCQKRSLTAHPAGCDWEQR